MDNDERQRTEEFVERIKEKIGKPLKEVGLKLGLQPCPKCKEGLLNVQTGKCMCCDYDGYEGF